MAVQTVFKRYEIKFLMSQNQAAELKKLMSEHMRGDAYGNSTISNIYLDTPDYILARRSIERPIYKEKLRIRSYGVANADTQVFCELKKKYDSIVYKRRISMRECEFESCIGGRTLFPDTQIGREIAYCFTRYVGLAPKVFLSYEREAFYAKDDINFRMTFDNNIMWRDHDLSLTKGIYGTRIISPDQTLLEVKTSTSIPLWLTGFLSANKIYKTSFSKYGNAYTAIVEETQKGGKLSA